MMMNDMKYAVFSSNWQPGALKYNGKLAVGGFTNQERIFSKETVALFSDKRVY